MVAEVIFPTGQIVNHEVAKNGLAWEYIRMPTLDWIGKKAVIGHHREVPFHLLKTDEKLSVGEPGSGNLLIEGDNLLALKALLPYYAGKVKCIYIDPPYNTGEQTWTYNDAVKSYEIERWLGKVVGREAEDLSRHDKWLCMMYPRIQLLRKFLRNDGVIFVSIDETELANLRLLMDEIFCPLNQLGTLIWKRRSSSAMRGMPLSIDHEYILIYAFNATRVKLYGFSKGIESYPLSDDRGNYASTDLTVGMNKEARPNQYYNIKNPRSGKVYPPNPERVWRFFPETMNKVIEANLIIWPDEAGGRMERPRYKTYYDPESEKPKPVSSWIENSGRGDNEIEEEETEYDLTILSSGMNQEGGKLIQQMLGTKAFSYPKPLSLIRSIIQASTKDEDIILDSFAGSGTTAHATLSLNKDIGGGRRFLLIEMEKEICREITSERILRAIKGYEFTKSKGKKESIEGLGGGFRYTRLGPTMFDETGAIRAEVSFGDLAAHVFFAETGEPIPKISKGRSPLLGAHNGVAVYLLYNGILGDKRANGGNVLTQNVLKRLPSHDGPRVIYGTGCRLGTARLKREGIVFKQIPYAIKVS